jgi:hypothetical protein
MHESRPKPFALGRTGLIIEINGIPKEYVPKKMPMQEFVRAVATGCQYDQEQFLDWLEKNANEVARVKESGKFEQAVERLLNG